MKFNRDESKLFEMLSSGLALSISTMQAALFPHAATGNSRVRNALRRLVREKLVRRTSPGTYKITAKGERR